MRVPVIEPKLTSVGRRGRILNKLDPVIGLRSVACLSVTVQAGISMHKREDSHTFSCFFSQQSHANVCTFLLSPDGASFALLLLQLCRFC